MAKIEDIPNRPATPVVIRFLGCDAEMVGVNKDFFTVGDATDCDIAFPEAMKIDGRTMLRIGRAAEGWRLNRPSGIPFYLNQEVATRSVSLRSGDVIRLLPGGPGMQFNILNQNSETLSTLIARYAPRLTQSTSGEAPIENAMLTTAHSRMKAERHVDASQSSHRIEAQASNSFVSAQWFVFRNYPKATTLLLIAIVICLAIASAFVMWPEAKSVPSNGTIPAVSVPEISDLEPSPAVLDTREGTDSHETDES